MDTQTPRYNAYMPSAGIASFLRSPICEDFSKVEADVAVLGIPYDCGVGYRPGTRFGPREIRNQSTRYASWGTGNAAGYWDVNQKKRFLRDVSIVDCGDVDITYFDIAANMAKITESVSALLARGALPVILGGDHSVTFPNVRAFAPLGPIDIVHIDAHMDWRDDIAGVRFTNASPLRRSKELPFVRHMVQLGIRDVRTRESDYADATAQGVQIVTREDIRERGVAAVLGAMPELGNVFVTIDIDGLDPSIAPGTGSPTVDGLLYHEVRALLQGVAARGNVVGFDLVEVNPFIDVEGQTSLLATTLILEFLGAIFAARGR
ncbi:Proclavaminate amidinohydrolase [Starkeya nomas]|uniref:Proclavaminate amidinohydrolase n=1 Tax=Starkeya nomas TaxID=2666134 RepID=A0A5S9P3B8_9HYPH|nr:agmatinase [Starkeya nomas]CAA0097807.1 Proclavaminate amidinohydrolase [Starkeya nomas]